MTDHLKLLVQQWNAQAFYTKLALDRATAEAKILCDLNAEIFLQCNKEGIDIESLNLSKRDEPKSEPRKIRRVRKAVPDAEGQGGDAGADNSPAS